MNRHVIRYMSPYYQTRVRRYFKTKKDAQAYKRELSFIKAGIHKL